MITFTNDIEHFRASKYNSFEIAIGSVKHSLGLCIKIIYTSKQAKFSKDLNCPITGNRYAGYYNKRIFYNIAFRKLKCDNKWYFIKNKTIVKAPIKDNK